MLYLDVLPDVRADSVLAAIVYLLPPENEFFNGKISCIKRYLPYNNLIAITLLIPQKN